MILSTHGIVGAAIIKIMPTHPVIGGILAFLSHFAMDAIPHWDYHLESFERNPDPMKTNVRINRAFLKDFIKISLDASLGILLPLIIFKGTSPWLIAMGAALAILPDALQFAYFKIKKEPLSSLQRFHIWAHSKNPELRTEPVIGPALQASLLITILYLLGNL